MATITTPAPTLQTLHEDILGEICSHMKPEEAHSFGATCRSFRVIADDQYPRFLQTYQVPEGDRLQGPKYHFMLLSRGYIHAAHTAFSDRISSSDSLFKTMEKLDSLLENQELSSDEIYNLHRGLVKHPNGTRFLCAKLSENVSTPAEDLAQVVLFRGYRTEWWSQIPLKGSYLLQKAFIYNIPLHEAVLAASNPEIINDPTSHQYATACLAHIQLPQFRRALRVRDVCQFSAELGKVCTQDTAVHLITNVMPNRASLKVFHEYYNSTPTGYEFNWFLESDTEFLSKDIQMAIDLGVTPSLQNILYAIDMNKSWKIIEILIRASQITDKEALNTILTQYHFNRTLTQESSQGLQSFCSEPLSPPSKTRLLYMKTTYLVRKLVPQGLRNLF